jgi:hypothetical protein
MVIVGWDVSTSAIGICVKREGLPNLYHVIFPKGTTHLEKHRDAYWKVHEWIEQLCLFHGASGPFHHFVEDRLGGFSGVTTKQTLMALAAMNAVVSLSLSGSGVVTHIPPVTTKRIMELKVDKDVGEDKKQAVVKLARSSDPSFPYQSNKTGKGDHPWKKGVDDMADAWLLAEAGAKVLKGEAEIGPKKKTRGGKKKTRRPKDPEG